MKRLCAAAVLLLLGSPCYAGESYSFYVGGHHVHIDMSRRCRSTSCVSVSVNGVYERRDYYDDDDSYDRDERHSRSDHDERFKDSKRETPPRAPVAAPPARVTSPPAASPSPAPVTASPPVARAPAPAVPVTPVAPPAPVQPQPQIQPPSVQPPTTAAVPSLAPQPAPAVAAPIVVLPAPPSPSAAPAADDNALPPPVTRPRPASRVVNVAHRVEEKPDSPLGDWETEGNKGVVRIEPCGQALCGYVLDPSTGAKGEAVLVGIKSKAASEWAGSIYSRDSGDSYYATVTLTEPNTLHVEACVLWRFWCSGNAWNRILRPGRMVTYPQISMEPRS
ncbi:MAG TPA: DUF2147 domain-containing protein [Bradyrhizobium sp.]|jgi:hypothetical protein